MAFIYKRRGARRKLRHNYGGGMTDLSRERHTLVAWADYAFVG